MIATILLVCILLALAATSYFPGRDGSDLPIASERDSKSSLAPGSVLKSSFRPSETRWHSDVLITFRPRSSNRIIAQKREVGSREPT